MGFTGVRVREEGRAKDFLASSDAGASDVYPQRASEKAEPTEKSPAEQGPGASGEARTESACIRCRRRKCHDRRGAGAGAGAASEAGQQEQRARGGKARRAF